MDLLELHNGSKKPRRAGQWQKGVSGNPSGKPPSVWQPPAVRAEYLAAKYGSDEIIALAKRIASGKKTPLSSQDCVVCVQLANIYELRDGIERERLYDRLFGKVPDRQINLNTDLDCTPEQLTERALALLARLAPEEPEAVTIEHEPTSDDISDLIDE